VSQFVIPTWVRIISAPELTPMECRFLLCVLWRQGKNGSAWAKQDTYASDVHTTDRHVRRLAENLEAKAWLIAKRQGRLVHYAIPEGKRTPRSGIETKETGHPGPPKPDIPVRPKQTPWSGHNRTRKRTLKRTPFSSEDDAFRLARLLLDSILQWKPDFKRPDLQTWALHIDKMFRLDKRTAKRIETVIRWCQSDSFWQSNVLSARKLRDKFDTLEAKMRQGAKSHERHGNTNRQSFADQQSQFGVTAKT
jgi:hypothetical protein